MKSFSESFWLSAMMWLAAAPLLMLVLGLVLLFGLHVHTTRLVPLYVACIVCFLLALVANRRCQTLQEQKPEMQKAFRFLMITDALPLMLALELLVVVIFD